MSSSDSEDKENGQQTIKKSNPSKCDDIRGRSDFLTQSELLNKSKISNRNAIHFLMK